MQPEPQCAGEFRIVCTAPRKRSPQSRKFLNRLCLVPLCAALLLVSGCGAARRLHADYTNYEAVYADTSNHEMLLNLARLDQHDPTFFFKMGQIGTSYQMTAGLSGSGNYMIQGTGAGGNAIGGGSPTLTYQKTPTFQFIPVDDNTTALQLLKPIDPEIFYSLYQQGWRVDQLFRVMVDHIEFREPGGKYWEVIRNSPDPDNAANYARFLRVGALAYELQKRGYLHLEGQGQGAHVVSVADPKNPPNAKDILDAKAANLSWKLDTDGQWKLEQSDVVGVFSLNTPSTQQELLEAAFAANTAGDQTDAANYKTAAVAAAAAQKADAAAAAADALRVANPDDKDDATDATAKDKARTAADNAAFDSLSNALITQIDVDMPELKNGGKNGANGLETVQKVFLDILRDGFSVSGTYNSPENTADAGKYSCRLVMRSLIGVMAAAAQEQDEFANLIKNNPQVPADPDPTNPGPQPSMRFTDVVPVVELHPILQLKWDVTEPQIPALVDLTYRDTHYVVTDIAPPAQSTPDQDLAWNRDVFRLISQLTAQVTVDISKFPLPAILQLNAQ